MVKEKWAPNSNFLQAAGNFQKEAVAWNRSVFGHIMRRKKQILGRLNRVNRELEQSWSHSLASLEEQLRLELYNILKQEELLWYQKSRKTWFTNGDRNTQYFHLSAMTRRKRNRIDRLQDQEGNWVEDQMKLKEMVVQYFKDLFSAQATLTIDPCCAAHFPALELA